MTTPALSHQGLELYHGDALAVLATLPASSCDAMVTDPPSGISFMNKTWDHDHGGREGWIEAFACIFRECRRVLKPGAFGLVWALPRTSHWTATALEEAGFTVRDVITHHFGSGFPKSLDVSKAIDAALGAKREKIRVDGAQARNPKSIGGKGIEGGDRPCLIQAREVGYIDMDGPEPVTEEAKRWQGWGTALKPATEHWILVRAPLAEHTVARNVLAHGTGGLNIEGCRVDGTPEATRFDPARHNHEGWRMTATGADTAAAGLRYNPPTRKEKTAALGSFANCDGEGTWVAGRWPANLVLSHSAACVEVGTKRPTSTGIRGGNMFGGGEQHQAGVVVGYADAEGLETVPAWNCAPDCPVAELDRQSGESESTDRPRHNNGSHWGGGAPFTGAGFSDAGGASRFFYCAKPSRAEREAGLRDAGVEETIVGSLQGGGEDAADPVSERFTKSAANTHPTVKAVDLMRWLCRLVTPPGGLVLDPFVGSGSTLIAAHAEGFRAIGIEREQEYVAIAKARMPVQYNLFGSPETVQSGS